MCNGYLIWDYFNGDVICSDCGEVVDRIYDYGQTLQDKLLTEKLERHVLRKF